MVNTSILTPYFIILSVIEEAYIHQYVTRPDVTLSLEPPFRFSQDEDDEEARMRSDGGTPPHATVTIELRTQDPLVEEKEDPFSYQPAADC